MPSASVISVYPHPMYLVGLSEGFMFGQPFHNIPISAPETAEAGAEDADPEADSEGLRFLQALLEQEAGETGARTGAP